MHFEDFTETKVRNQLFIIVSPILVVLGTLGNVVSFFVLNQRQRSRTSTTIYLSTLAVVDIVVLYAGLLRHWIIRVFNIDVRTASEFGCKIHTYILCLGIQLSSWILVAVTVERAISVCRPHMVKVGCTKKFASVLVLTEIIILAVLNVHFLFGFNIPTVHVNASMYVDNEGFLADCVPNSDHKMYIHFVHYWMPWVDLGVAFLVPFVILLCGNIVILINIKRSRRFQRKMTTYHTRITLNSTKPVVSLTIVLLTLNSVFFICNGPITVFHIGQFYWWPKILPVGQELAVQQLTLAVINILMYTNKAVNFLLYVMCGAEFRTEVKLLMLKCCRRRHLLLSEPAANSIRLTSTNPPSFDLSSYDM